MADIKFFCPCGQKVALPAELLDRIGTCPTCGQPLVPPPEVLTAAPPPKARDRASGRTPGGTQRRASTGSHAVAGEGTAGRRARGSGRREAASRSGRGLPLWFYLSFLVDLIGFGLAWKALNLPVWWAAGVAEAGGWTLRLALIKWNL